MNEIALASINADLFAMEQRGRLHWLVLGHIAEDIVAALHPDWTRTPPFTKAHDFITPQGVKVEVKAISGKAKVAKFRAGRSDTTWIKPGAARLIIILFDGIQWQLICDCPIEQALWANQEHLIPKGHRYAGCLIWKRAWDRIESASFADSPEKSK